LSGEPLAPLEFNETHNTLPNAALFIHGTESMSLIMRRLCSEMAGKKVKQVDPIDSCPPLFSYQAPQQHPYWESRERNSRKAISALNDVRHNW
jgi:hypothetical protein